MKVIISSRHLIDFFGLHLHLHIIIIFFFFFIIIITIIIIIIIIIIIMRRDGHNYITITVNTVWLSITFIKSWRCTRDFPIYCSDGGAMVPSGPPNFLLSDSNILIRAIIVDMRRQRCCQNRLSWSNYWCCLQCPCSILALSGSEKLLSSFGHFQRVFVDPILYIIVTVSIVLDSSLQPFEKVLIRHGLSNLHAVLLQLSCDKLLRSSTPIFEHLEGSIRFVWVELGIVVK